MKSIIPDPQQLDELAAGLDAGWDEEPAETSPSQPPLSTPPPELEALDADWDVAATPTTAATPATAAARAAQARPNQARPSRTRPSPNRAVTAPSVVGVAPLRASKQERREAERKRRAHEAQQKTANKKERKAERQIEARKASEQLRLAQEQALAERNARVPAPAATPMRKRQPAKSEASEAQIAKRAAKRERREAPVSPRVTRPAREVAATKPQAIAASERTSNKFLVPVLIAIAVVFAVTLGFALSRSH